MKGEGKVTFKTCLYKYQRYAVVAVMLRRMRRVSPINSCHTLLVSDDGDTISEANNTSLHQTPQLIHFTLYFTVCVECARCLSYL